jgi:hypothetical protein
VKPEKKKKEPPVPVVQEAGWAPEPVCTQRLDDKLSCMYLLLLSVTYFQLSVRQIMWFSESLSSAFHNPKIVTISLNAVLFFLESIFFKQIAETIHKRLF